MEKVKYRISKQVQTSIYTFYTNVAKKYCNTYSLDLMAKNISNAYSSIYNIENGLMRRKPIIKQWNGYFMANTDKWYFAYKIVENTIYIEDARHSQNMSEFSTSNTLSNQQQHSNRVQKKSQYKLTGDNMFGYRVVKLKNKNQYNLIKQDGALLCTQWFNAIHPLPNLYGKYKIMAYVNIGGLTHALSKDGKVYSLKNLRENKCIDNIAYENVGEWDIVTELNSVYSLFPWKYEGLENFGLLHRYIMYANPSGDTYCVFRIPKSEKYLFAKLHNKSHFEPIKKEKIPQILFNHFQYLHQKN